jgi:hypothetical protein
MGRQTREWGFPTRSDDTGPASIEARARTGLGTLSTSGIDLTGAAERGSPFRVDPAALPARFTYRTGLSGVAEGAAVVIDPTMISVARKLPSGIPLVLRFPPDAFEGVCVEVAADGETLETTVTLMLRHRDPQLSVPLAVYSDLEDVVADWLGWARALRLPRLMAEPDGRVTAIDQRLGALDVRPTAPRRRRSVLSKRRPRFLARRKPGTVGAQPMVMGAEMTAGR